MDISTIDRTESENFIIQNNIVKGAKIDFGVKNQSLGQLLLDTFSQYADHLGWIEPETGKQITFGQMKDRSIRLALWLKQQGIGSGDIVTICSPNCLNNYVVMYSIFYVGAVYNSWHHEFTLDSARHAYKVAKPKIVFTTSLMIDTIQETIKLENGNTRIVVYDDCNNNKETFEDFIQMRKIKDVETFTARKIENLSTEPASLLFSSGTSGPAKAVKTNYNHLLNLILTCSFKHMIPNKVTLWYSTTYWILGMRSMLASVFSRSIVILCRKYDPEYICQLIEKYQINLILGFPNFISSICKNKFYDRYDFSSVSEILVGGAKLSQHTIDGFRTHLSQVNRYQIYGMTENGLVCKQTNKCKSPTSVGYVVPNVQVKTIDQITGKTLGPNEAGEICVMSSFMFNGYYANMQATIETIDEDGWLHTGDVGYYDDSGEFFIIDRIKNIMKFRFHHIYPLDISELLLKHPDVVDVGVTSYPHEEDVEHVMAFVQKVPGSKVTEEELVELSSTLGFYKKLWGGVKFVDALPRTMTGKIATGALKEMAKAYADSKK
ncbi:luciferin 4-monooxygenase [Nasonia vitripennis]|uniref:Uncharacterized protein n=1 Tax=Nasonia vitripennis TaxID=7425 RepID=A0A7M7G2B0_NASVI|nr:luciferin 4-monooxygenase [Nasonia vitripennis]